MKIVFVRKQPDNDLYCVHCMERAKRDDKGRLIPCNHGKSEKK